MGLLLLSLCFKTLGSMCSVHNKTFHKPFFFSDLCYQQPELVTVKVQCVPYQQRDTIQKSIQNIFMFSKVGFSFNLKLFYANCF